MMRNFDYFGKMKTLARAAILNRINRRKKVENIVFKTPSYLNRYPGSDFLVLASGKHLKTQEESVREFIKKVKPITIGSNDLAWFTQLDYHTFFNRRRFCTFAGTIHKGSRVILNPHFPKRIIRKFYTGDYEVAMFRDVDDRSFDIEDGIISSNCRSSAILGIALAIVMGAENIYAAGLDGFIDIYNSYEGYIEDTPFTCSYDELREIQRHYLSLIQEYLKSRDRKPFFILTKTSFQEHYKDINTFLR